MCSGAGFLSAFVLLAALAWSPCAHAQEPRATRIWYRSADGCPDGAAFLGRLESRGVHAALARVGDPIDFVVTLGTGPDGARGLLERQTETKTVAIRQLDGGTCDQVADAIALSLVVANTPHTETTEPVTEPAAPAVSPAPVAPATPPAPVTAPPAAAPRSSSPLRWAFGLHGDALFAAAPSTMFGADVFGELEFPGGRVFAPALRLAAFEAQTLGDAKANVLIAGGRVEACPVRVGTEVVEVRPCASLALGAIRAETKGPHGRVDHGFWGTVDLLARLAVRIAKPVWAEAQGGISVPLERYEFVSESEDLSYRAGAVGATVSVGAAIRLP